MKKFKIVLALFLTVSLFSSSLSTTATFAENSELSPEGQAIARQLQLNPVNKNATYAESVFNHLKGIY